MAEGLDHRAAARLIVVDCEASAPFAARPAAGAGRATVVSFHSDFLAAEALAGGLRAQGMEVALEAAGGRLEEAAARLRPDFLRLQAAALDGPRVGGRTLREAWRWRGLPLWWLTEWSGKRGANDYPIFNRLCRLAIFGELLEGSDWAGGVEWVCDGAAMAECYALAAAARGFDAEGGARGRGAGGARGSGAGAAPPRSATENDRVLHFGPAARLKMFAGNAAWFARAWLRTRAAVRLAPSIARAGAESEGAAAFYTIRPALWRLEGNRRDEKYGPVPRALAEAGGRAVILGTLAADGLQQDLDAAAHADQARVLAREGGRPDGLPFHLLEAFATAGDHLLGVWDSAAAQAACRRLERGPEFRSHWRWRGASVWPLVREDLRKASVRAPRLQFQSRAAERWALAARPAAVVATQFEFCFGRALIHGWRRGGARSGRPPALVGAQHGSVNANFLAYQLDPSEAGPEGPPLPDLVLLEGEGARAVAEAGGFAAGRLAVVGAPRVAGLWERMDRLAADAAGAAGATNMTSAANSEIPANSPVVATDERAGGRGGPAAGAPPTGPADGRPTALVVFGLADGATLLGFLAPAIRALPRWRFLLQPHPRAAWTPDRVRGWLEANGLGGGAPGAAEVEVGGAGGYADLPRAWVVVSGNTGFSVEAAAMGWPSILLRLPDRFSLNPLLGCADAPPLWWAGDAEQLRAALDQAEALGPHKPAPHAGVLRHAYGDDPRGATRRWVGALLPLLDPPRM